MRKRKIGWLMAKVCSWCKEKYKGKRPSNFASNPECAFDSNGVFQESNWNCAGLGILRKACYEREVWNDDQHCAILSIKDQGSFIILSYYKHRGRTEGAWLVKEETIQLLTVDDITSWITPT